MMASYVGIKNDHSVCYLNSVIQQLFMMPSFREQIFQFTLQQEDVGSNCDPKQSFLLELKSLFMSLENGRSLEDICSRRSDEAIDPLPFCKTVWNPLGSSDEIGMKDESYLDVDKQMDASEFLSLLLAQLSSSLDARNSLLQIGRHISGTLCNELYIADDASTRVIGKNLVVTSEQFYFISVKVGSFGAVASTASASTSASSTSASSTSTSASLSIAVSPPVTQSIYINTLRKALEEFTSDQDLKSFWRTESSVEEGQREMLVSKSSSTISASSLPSHFIVHLKRFRFDYTKMRQVKVNSRFEYPLNIDLWDYTSEARKERADDAVWESNMRKGVGAADEKESTATDITALRKRCKYVLGGVIIHTGTARDGHYFSIVKERNQVNHTTGQCTTSKQAQVSMQDRWLKMNDEEVTEFSVEDLERESFGGHAHGPLKKQNAFILIYDMISHDVI